MRAPGDILLVSCYELGRQPAGLAWAAGALEEAGFAPELIDLSLDSFEEPRFSRARLVAVSAPMHTAMRLGSAVLRRTRALNRSAQLAVFGLYAQMNRAYLADSLGALALGDDAALDLVGLARSMEEGGLRPAQAEPGSGAQAERGNGKRALPVRSGLPKLERYAQLAWRGELRSVASVDASLGCKHLCRHCPVVPVWKGRFRALPQELVLADLDAQVAMGARHASFGDPDFLNGPTHALRIARELHRRHPTLTFDFTAKVEHLLAHAELLPELQACGALFITSAFESTSDRVLLALDKGHTAKDLSRAVAAVRGAGLEVRPTWVPYTPWTTEADLRAMFEFAAEQDLVEAIDAVQYTLRLLLPPGSPLVEMGAAEGWLLGFEPENFGHRWRHPEPRLDALRTESSRLVEQHLREDCSTRATFAALRALVDPEARTPAPTVQREIPRLTEPWFCCAEPTPEQLQALGG